MLEHVNQQEYGECIKRVLEIVKVKKLISKSIVNARTGNNSSDDELELPDNHQRSFSDEWLPPWKLLKASLLDEWSLRVTQGAVVKDKNKNVLPIAMNGIKGMTCWGCGGPHKIGDPGCSAGKFDVHHSTPPMYKARMKKKRKAEKSNGGGGNGKGSGDGNRTPIKKQKNNEGEKKHCKAFNQGRGIASMELNANSCMKRMKCIRGFT